MSGFKRKQPSGLRNLHKNGDSVEFRARKAHSETLR